MPSAEIDSADKKKNKHYPCPYKHLMTLNKKVIKAALQDRAEHSTSGQKEA